MVASNLVLTVEMMQLENQHGALVHMVSVQMPLRVHLNVIVNKDIMAIDVRLKTTYVKIQRV